MIVSTDSLCKSNEVAVLRDINIKNKNITKRTVLSEEFKDFAQFQRNGKRLVHNGYFYLKNSDSNDRTFWLCSRFQKFKCKARAITRVIDGYEMVKIRSTPHSHPPEES